MAFSEWLQAPHFGQSSSGSAGIFNTLGFPSSALMLGGFRSSRFQGFPCVIRGIVRIFRDGAVEGIAGRFNVDRVIAHFSNL